MSSWCYICLLFSTSHLLITDVSIVVRFQSDYSASYMLEIRTCCWRKLFVAGSLFDGHLLSDCLPYWKGDVVLD